MADPAAPPVTGETSAEAPPARDPTPLRAPFRAQAQGLDLTFYPGGPQRLETMLALIEGARESLKLAFYIFSPDESGRRVRDALTEAAQRGVAVTLMVDGFGTEADDAFFAPLTEAGGAYFCFLAKPTRRYLIRNHQKIFVADGKVALLGGFNVEDSYFAPPEEPGWTDLAVRIEGAVVDRIGAWFDELREWCEQRHAQFRSIRRKVRDWHDGDGPVQLLIGGPTKGLSSWARCVRRDLAQGERLDMIMAYFSPSRSMLRRISRIARKGQTRLVLAGKSDNAATIGASRALYGGLLKSGARIWEYQPRMLHMKLIVLDDAVYFGSANFDMRSLFLNLEIVLRIEDAELAERMREFISGYLPDSLEITPERHAARASWWAKARWWACWGLVSVVDYTVSRKLNLGLG